MTDWTEFVKAYAAKKKIPYMAAMSDAKCRELYQKSKVKKEPVLKLPKEKSEKLKLPKKKAVASKKVIDKFKGKLFGDIQ